MSAPFPFKQFYSLIDLQNVEEAVDLIGQKGGGLDLRVKSFLLGLVFLAGGRIANGYRQIVQAADGDCTEQMILEAAAAMSARLGRLEESIYYAKLASAMEVGVVPSLPKLIGNFQTNVQTIEERNLTRKGLRALRVGQIAPARKLFEESVQIDPQDIDAWRGLVQCSLGGRQPLGAIQAGRALGALARNTEDQRLALSALLNAASPDVLDEGTLDRLEPGLYNDLLIYAQYFSELQTRIDEAGQKYHKAGVSAPASNLSVTQERQLVAGRKRKPEAHKNYWQKKTRTGKAKPLRLLVLSNVGLRERGEMPLLDTLAQYRMMNAAIIVYHLSPKQDELSRIYSSLFEDWNRIRDIDEETLAVMAGNENPDLILDLTPGDNCLDHVLEKTGVPVRRLHSYQPEKALFRSLDEVLAVLSIPKIAIIPDTPRPDVMRTEPVDPAQFQLPDSLTHLRAGLLTLFDGFPEGMLGVHGKNLCESTPLANMKQVFDIPGDDTIDFSWPAASSPESDKRQVLVDLPGLEHFFITLLTQGIIPDLVALPRSSSKAAKINGHLQPLYYLLELEDRIVSSPAALFDLPPVDAARWTRLYERVKILQSAPWRQGSAMALASLLQDHVNAS